MTQADYNINTYGCTNPMCGNCQWIRSTECSLRCLVGRFKKVDFDSVKCVYYKHNPNGIKEVTGEELYGGWLEIRKQAMEE